MQVQTEILTKPLSRQFCRFWSKKCYNNTKVTLLGQEILLKRLMDILWELLKANYIIKIPPNITSLSWPSLNNDVAMCKLPTKTTLGAVHLHTYDN